MITVISRPQAHKLADIGPTGSLTSSSGEAFITTDFAHGLVDDDWIYMQSNFESYTGFFQVTDTTYNSFKLLRRGSVVAFKQNADVSYQVSVFDHGFIPVHNPIVYELESDLNPHNVDQEAYTPITVNSQTNEDGYARLHLSAPLEDPEELEFIKITSGTTAGIYQILEVFYDWDIVINLAYNASNTFGQVVKYYNNYVINVNVWAGYPITHPWESVKPYEVAAQLQFTPDENNRVKFSINDLLRGYLKLRNNLLLDTLPNNTDFSCAFFIEYWESFDVSDGSEITTNDESATEDTFEGYAIQAAMPFKTLGLSDYVNQDTYLAKWLVIQQYPIASLGKFFDMSFLLTQLAESDPGFTPDHPDVLSFWGIANTSSEPMVWTGGIANPFLTISTGVSVGGLSDHFNNGVTYETGRTYKYSYTADLAATFGGPGNVHFRIHLAVCDTFNNILDEFIDDETILSTFPSGSSSGTFEFIAPAGANRVAFVIEIVNGTTNNALFTITSFTDETATIPPTSGGTLIIYVDGDQVDTIENPGLGVIRVPFAFQTTGRHCVKVGNGTDDITEELCVDVIDECSSTFIDQLRLLESTSFRLLE